MDRDFQAVDRLILRGERDLLASLDQLYASEISLGGDGQVSATFKRCLEGLPSPYPAWAYLGYYRLGAWLLSGSIADAWRMAQWIDNIHDAIRRYPGEPSLVLFGDAELAPEPIWDAVLSLFQEGGDFVEDLELPDSVLFSHWRQTMAAARTWIEAVDPELFTMMSKLQSIVIATRPGPLARQKGQNFGGGTCFFLRGASIMNVSSPISTAAMIERLVHEYAHAELFVFSQDQPPCLNRDEERHSVLIRRDPRPMNGILHSLHVVSRVAEILSKLRRIEKPPSLMDAIDSDELLDLLQQQLRFGDSSLSVITQHAQLTPLGETIVTSARKRLQAAAPVG